MYACCYIYVTVCLLLYTLLPAVTLNKCVSQRALFVFCVTATLPRRFQNNALITVDFATHRRTSDAKNLDSPRATSLCRLELQCCHPIFVVNSKVRNFSRKRLVKSRSEECDDFIGADTDNRLRGWGLGFYG